MGQKTSRHFTLMIMPETAGAEVKRLRVARRSINVALTAVVIVFLVAVASVSGNVVQYFDKSTSVILDRENAQLKERIASLDARIDQLTTSVETIKSFEGRLRKMTMVSDPARNLAIGPVGDVAKNGQRGAAKAANRLRRDLLGDNAEEAASLVSGRLVQAELDARQAQKSVARLSAYLKGQRTLLSSIPSRRPTLGYMTSGFGMRVDPFTGLPQLHAGIDFLGGDRGAGDGHRGRDGHHGGNQRGVRGDHRD